MTHILYIICAQGSIFWDKNGRFWAKHHNYIGREQEVRCSHIRKPLRHLVSNFFGRDWHQMNQKVQYLAKKLPKMHIYLEKGYFFHCTTLPGRGQNMVSIEKWTLFLGPKTRFLARESVFCHTTQNFVNGPFVALGETVHFAPWDQYLSFRFRIKVVFVKKKTPADAPKSLPPPHS